MMDPIIGAATIESKEDPWDVPRESFQAVCSTSMASSR